MAISNSNQLLNRLKRVTKYAVEQFGTEDWSLLEKTLVGGEAIGKDNRLYRSLFFGDDDYPAAVARVVALLNATSPDNLSILESYCGLGDSQPLEMSANKHKGRLLVFISHASVDRQLASNMKIQLAQYGIDGFVAHEDIEVSSAWVHVIEENLRECDAMVFLSSETANQSIWCQQEIGWAMGRDIPMLGVHCESNPGGFLGFRQSCELENGAINGAVDKLLTLLLQSNNTETLAIDSIIERLVFARSFDEASRLCDTLRKATTIGLKQARRIDEAIRTNDQVYGSNNGKLPDALHDILLSKTIGYSIPV